VAAKESWEKNPAVADQKVMKEGNKRITEEKQSAETKLT